MQEFNIREKSNAPQQPQQKEELKIAEEEKKDIMKEYASPETKKLGDKLYQSQDLRKGSSQKKSELALSYQSTKESKGIT